MITRFDDPGRRAGSTTATLPSAGAALPLPAVLLLAVVLVALLVLAGTLSEPPGGIGALRLPTPTSEPTMQPTITPTATATSAPTPLPSGYQRLLTDVSSASFALRPDPARPETALRLAMGRVVRPMDERQGERCRVALLDDDADDGNNARVWLDCSAIER